MLKVMNAKTTPLLSVEDEIKQRYNDALLEAQWDFHFRVRGLCNAELAFAKDDFNRELAAIHRTHTLELARLSQLKDKPDANTHIIEAPPPAALGSIHDGLDMGTGQRPHNAPEVD